MDASSSGIGLPSSATNLQAVEFAGRLEALKRGVGEQPVADAAEQLEALFATMLVKELRRALPEGLFGKGVGSDTFEGWFDQHMGDALTESGALDLAGRLRTAIENKASKAEGER